MGGRNRIGDAANQAGKYINEASKYSKKLPDSGKASSLGGRIVKFIEQNQALASIAAVVVAIALPIIVVLGFIYLPKIPAKRCLKMLESKHPNLKLTEMFKNQLARDFSYNVVDLDDRDLLFVEKFINLYKVGLNKRDKQGLQEEIIQFAEEINAKDPESIDKKEIKAAYLEIVRRCPIWKSLSDDQLREVVELTTGKMRADIQRKPEELLELLGSGESVEETVFNRLKVNLQAKTEELKLNFLKEDPQVSSFSDDELKAAMQQQSPKTEKTLSPEKRKAIVGQLKENIINQVRQENFYLSGLSDNQVWLFLQHKDVLEKMTNDEQVLILNNFGEDLIRGKSAAQLREVIASADKIPEVIRLKQSINDQYAEMARLDSPEYFKERRQLWLNHLGAEEFNRLGEDHIKNQIDREKERSKTACQSIINVNEVGIDALKKLHFQNLNEQKTTSKLLAANKASMPQFQETWQEQEAKLLELQRQRIFRAKYGRK